MDKNVSNSFKTLAELSNSLSEKRASWHHQLLVASSALFGILISLHGKTPLEPLTRWTFAGAVVLLSLGILLTGISLYTQIDAMSRARKEATKEAKSALHEDRAMRPVSVPEKKTFSICAKASYICFGISVLLLAAYAVIISI